MSHSGMSLHEIGIHSAANRFQDLLSLDHNKPDFRELDLGSPVVNRSGSCGGTTNAATAAAAIIANGGVDSSGSASYHNPLAKESNLASTASENHRSMATTRISKMGHRRWNSTGSPLIYSGYTNYSNCSGTSTSSSTTADSSGSDGGLGGGCATSVSSPNTMAYPSGNICPSGKILKSNMGSRSSNRTEKLGSGTRNYGHGSIIKGRGGKLEPQFSGDMALAKRATSCSEPEEVKRVGNEFYRRGQFAEALSMYDKAIVLLPESAAYRSNRAAALTMLGRLGEAVKECEEAVRLDPGYGRAHQRLGSLFLRLGQVENARRHLNFSGQQPDKSELQKLELLEKHLKRCKDARKTGDWRRVLRECDAAMVAGAESSPQIIACKAEAFLKLHQLEEADSNMSGIPKLEPNLASCSQIKFFGFLGEAYVLYVWAQVDMSFGRFESAAAAAEKAGLIDYNNIEVAMFLNNVKLVTRARARGKDLFDSGRFTEACAAYGEGLKYNLCNSVLRCNRAVCWSKLGLWEQTVEDCNHALKIQPNHTKALLLRAVSNAKLERWAEAVKDYEVLRGHLPGDNVVAEPLLRAQVALKKSCEGEVHNVKLSEAEEIYGLDQFKAAKSVAGGCQRRAQP